MNANNDSLLLEAKPILEVPASKDRPRDLGIFEVASFALNNPRSDASEENDDTTVAGSGCYGCGSNDGTCTDAEDCTHQRTSDPGCC